MVTLNKHRTLIKKLFIIFNFINRIIPKKPNKIMLYSNFGFRENVRALFGYLIDNGFNNRYIIVCSTNESKDIQSKNLHNVIVTNEFLGLFHFFTSKYFFYCFGKYPIEPGDNQIVVNLWHGMPLKTIGNLEKGYENMKYNYFTYLLATSEGFKVILQKAFNCDEKAIIICSQPRNDSLFSQRLSGFKKHFGQLIT
ncbi:MAG: CDP-glycerol glycerophosphotransferase family protein [Candidatus Omnitrophota bacterium]